ncbi:MAG: protein-L-isoaspartate(D-aspartate) O-methyltransferase [Myxococcota bacterium]|nr:protein-L-isoaspartate(D-aspartate) O-methyltransferase [Myxococcota bacterium]
MSRQGDRFYLARQQMVELQLVKKKISDEDVLRLMRTIPREDFIPESLRQHAYEARPVDIGYGQIISEPYMVAWMTESLALSRTARVLEIGTGCGYQSAILASLAQELYSIEVLPELAHSAQQRLFQMGFENIFFRVGDGWNGWREAGPFDAILVAAAAPEIPPPLIDQLAPGGRLVIPVGEPGHTQRLCYVERRGAELIKQTRMLVRFVPMVGRAEWFRGERGGIVDLVEGAGLRWAEDSLPPASQDPEIPMTWEGPLPVEEEVFPAGHQEQSPSKQDQQTSEEEEISLRRSIGQALDQGESFLSETPGERTRRELFLGPEDFLNELVFDAPLEDEQALSARIETEEVPLVALDGETELPLEPEPEPESEPELKPEPASEPEPAGTLTLHSFSAGPVVEQEKSPPLNEKDFANEGQKRAETLLPEESSTAQKVSSDLIGTLDVLKDEQRARVESDSGEASSEAEALLEGQSDGEKVAPSPVIDKGLSLPSPRSPGEFQERLSELAERIKSLRARINRTASAEATGDPSTPHKEE